MGVEVRPFRRSDREQVARLVNAHIATVIPGASVPVNTVLSQLEREPSEFIVDPWVAEGATLVAVERDRVVAAAHLRRYGTGDHVGDAYRDVGKIAWLVSWPDAPFWPDRGAGNELAARCLEQLRSWGVGRMYADGALPAPGVYGVPEQWPHVRAIFGSNGFVHTGRTEIVLIAAVDEIADAEAPFDGMVIRRSLGINGTRLSAGRGDDEVGYIELDTELSGGSSLSRYVGYADIGNLEAAEGPSRRPMMGWLLARAADWLRLARVDRLLAYAELTDVELTALFLETGFKEVTRTACGWVHSAEDGTR